LHGQRLKAALEYNEQSGRASIDRNHAIEQHVTAAPSANHRLCMGGARASSDLSRATLIKIRLYDARKRYGCHGVLLDSAAADYKL
jgi:hypothetical protein